MEIEGISKDKLIDVLDRWIVFDYAHFSGLLRYSEAICNLTCVKFTVDGKQVKAYIVVSGVIEDYIICRRVYEDDVYIIYGKQYLQKLIKHGEFDGD